MRRIVIAASWLGLTGLAGLTFAGLFAPFAISLDLPNQFRLHILAAMIGLCLLAALLRNGKLLVSAMVFAALNFALAVPPFFFVAPPQDGTASVPLKVVMANIWGRNAAFGPLVEFLRRESADVVLLAEADGPIARTLADLSDLYPYQSNCISSHYCRLALLSRFPLEDVTIGDRTNEIPPHVLARIRLQQGSVNFVGTHLARPFSHRWQAREIDFLIGKLADMKGPAILAGDFNATPWSWTMLSLQLRANLYRHLTLGASWPANLPLPPQLLLDQVLSRGGIRRREAHLGSQINSDHLPVVATLLLPVSE